MNACLALRALALAGWIAFVLSAWLTPGPALAQTPQKAKNAQRPAASKSNLPDPYRVNMLIRTTLVALSQANQTGNYTVLRDLGSPGFQAVNSAARLGEIFGELRRRKLDFSPVVFFNPKLVRKPVLDEAGRLRLTGFIETRPERINFDMLFENVREEWRLFGLAVQMRPAPETTAGTGPNAAPESSSSEAKKGETTRASAPAKK